MPRKPKHPCSYPGCPKLTDGKYCEQHNQLMTQQERSTDAYKEHKRRYGYKWKRIRDRHIKQHPLCEKCKEKGRLTPAEEVHHILPLACGGTNDASNLMSLCKSCHSEITAYDKNTKNKRYFN